MMDPGEVIVALGAFSAITISITVITRAMLRAQENKLRSSSGARLGTETDARIERIEHAVDAIAIEIERISEGQRFTTRLLSDRVTSSR
jgi:hypothetical protein